MTQKNGYVEWTDHPRWKELTKLEQEYFKVKKKCEDLRDLIQKEVFGDAKNGTKDKSN